MENQEFIGFWKRVVAYIIDVVIVMVVAFVVSIILRMVMTFSSEEAVGQMAMSVYTIVFFSYFILLESSAKQATVGKGLLGMKVINRDGERLSILNAAGRNIARILSGLIFAIGYLMVLFTKKRQALHDILAKTYVVAK